MNSLSVGASSSRCSAAWPLSALAQEPMSVVGFLDSRSADNSPHSSLAAFHRSLTTMAERGMPE